MARIVGTWWGDSAYCLNFTPEYRFAKITKRTGKEYWDWTKSICEDVEVDIYGYKLVGTKCKPYVYDDWFYLPTVKVGHREGYFRIYHGKRELWIEKKYNGYNKLDPWNGKTPLTIRERFSRD